MTPATLAGAAGRWRRGDRGAGPPSRFQPPRILSTVNPYGKYFLVPDFSNPALGNIFHRDLQITEYRGLLFLRILLEKTTNRETTIRGFWIRGFLRVFSTEIFC